MSRPVIGISAEVGRARWGAWESEAVLLPQVYVTGVQAGGGLAMVLPPDDRVARSPDELLDSLDGLLLAGGPDIDPALYGAEPHPETEATSPGRDRFELALARRAFERDLPLLGICRGVELLNVATGGTLVQHLPDVLGHDNHRHTPGAYADHDVHLDPGSLAAAVVSAEQTAVKSHHHQALDALGEGVVASGWAIPDGIVEAIELPERNFAVGVLWHPEEDERARVLASFVAEARAVATR